MEVVSAEFLSALLAIVVIDLVLAGDNAIVIALAARNLPQHLRKRAIAWGTIGAIAVRTAMTLVVVWLLKIPGLLFVGGALLVWIAYKLLMNEDGEGHETEGARSFWGAMKTIVVADALMGLDNVLAVAGAAHGSFLLVVLGLLISIPIVIWGSQLILKFVERYPSIIYVGAGVLAWTAVKMMVSEPLLEPVLAEYPQARWIAYALVVGGVLGGGFLANHAGVRARVEAHIVDELIPAAAMPAAAPYRVLVPVDGSPNALKAVRHVIRRYQSNPATEIHLVNVRHPLSQQFARIMSRTTRDDYHREMGEKALAPARALFAQLGVPYAAHVEVGAKAEAIRQLVRRLGIDQIVMGTARRSSLTRMLQDSVTHRVLQVSEVPVEVLAGEAIAPLERYAAQAALLAVGMGLGVLLA